MQVLIPLTALFLAAVVGEPIQQKILGGSVTTVQNYPYAAALLNSNDLVNFNQACSGVILNNRSVLSAARCAAGTSSVNWRIRVGSSYASSGGELHSVSLLIIHPNYLFFENDIGLFRISSNFNFGGNVQPGVFAGANYNIADNQAVTSIGWGTTSFPSVARSEQLRQVQILTINQEVCRQNYLASAIYITPSLICAGNLNQGGAAPCDGDTGGPLLHSGVVAGIFSGSLGCGTPHLPAYYTRVSTFIDWIQSNA